MTICRRLQQDNYNPEPAGEITLYSLLQIIIKARSISTGTYLTKESLQSV